MRGTLRDLLKSHWRNALQDAAAAISRVVECGLVYAGALLDSDIADRQIRAHCIECMPMRYMNARARRTRTK